MARPKMNSEMCKLQQVCEIPSIMEGGDPDCPYTVSSGENATADDDRLSRIPHRPARRKLAEQVVAEMSRLSHERPEQHAACIEGDMLICRTCDRRWSAQAPCKVLRQLGGEKRGAQHSLSAYFAKNLELM